jgi:DEAD/DEAH box helicase domain-containing protein
VPGVLVALEELKHLPWYRGQLVHIEPLPSRAPSYAEPDPPLPAALRKYLESSGIERLYSHQVELLKAAREGRDVIITTGTASGKTLGFNLPIVESLIANRSATALYLYPMKAVTQDQLRVLSRLDQTSGANLRPAVYDGDTPRTGAGKPASARGSCSRIPTNCTRSCPTTTSGSVSSPTCAGS